MKTTHRRVTMKGWLAWCPVWLADDDLAVFPRWRWLGFWLGFTIWMIQRFPGDGFVFHGVVDVEPFEIESG